MQGWIEVSGAGIYLSCFGLSVVSALLPWVNCEVLLLVAWPPSPAPPFDLANLVLLTTAGQMAGKCGLYWAGRSGLRLQNGASRQDNCLLARAVRKVTLQAGGARVPQLRRRHPAFLRDHRAGGSFPRALRAFPAAGRLGRVLRFGLLALVPQLALRLMHH